MWPYAWNTLDEAASWLSNELGNIALTARQVLELGVVGKAALHAVVPERSIPQPYGRGFGVLKDFYEGFVKLTPNDCHVIAGRGSAQFLSVSHPSDPNKSIKLNHSVELNLSMLRISGDELRKIASEVRSRAKKRAVAESERRVFGGSGIHGKQREPAAGDASAEASGNWKDHARAIADELFDHDTKQQTRDSLDGYARRVMEKMQERGIHGPRGRFDNHNTIKREALQGSKWWREKPK